MLKNLSEVEIPREKWTYMQFLQQWLDRHQIQSSGLVTQPAELKPSFVFKNRASSELRALASDNSIATNSAFVEFLLILSRWYKVHAFSLVRKVVLDINKAGSINDVAALYASVSPHDFHDSLSDPSYELLLDPKASVCGARVHLKEGPVKTFESCMRKVSQVHNQRFVSKTIPNADSDLLDAAFITDTLRVSLACADPMIAVLLVVVLADVPEFTLKRVHNKYRGTIESICSTGSPSILVVVEMCCAGLPKMLFEIQIYIDGFLSLKKTQHQTYELKRGVRLQDIMSPIFPVGKSDGSWTVPETFREEDVRCI